MTNLRTYVALSATIAFIVLGQSMNAQDDLDDLLADLEGESPAAVAPAPAVEEPAPAPAVEEPAPAPAVEEPAPAPAVEEPAPNDITDDKVDDALGLLNELAAEDVDTAKTEQKVEEPAVVVTTEEPVPTAEATEAAPGQTTDAARIAALRQRKDGPLISEILTAEKLRRQAIDAQAMREIEEARAAMANGEFSEAVRHYGIATKLLNDRPASKIYKNECTEGIAEGLYRAALEEDRTGRRERAIKYMEKAVDLRHPKARRQLEAWLASEDPNAHKTDVSEITHRRNEADYKALREVERRHLKRARQLLAQREIDSALDECELVLAKSPYNQEALRLRDSITRKRDVILKQERDVARKAWIADVDKAWRPPYATDAIDREEKKGETVKKQPGEGGERTVEQTIIQRMKEMRLPAISFKPPATIIDAVDYFRGASKDFDDPSRPLEQRGFNFVLKTPEAVRMQAAAAPSEDADDFSDTGSGDAAGNGPLGVPVIPMITASDITFYDALKLVCESVEYKFTVQGPIVMVMHKDMSIEELVTRTFPVLSTFLEKMSSAREDITTMQSSAFGSSSRRRGGDNEEENQERDWKEVFSLLGVKWPEGSSIFFMKTLGKLFVKNTQENLAELESVLNELGGQIKLIEIETRFIEVCQDDLNSLGFEWILNSDYSLGLNKHVAKALGIRGGGWGLRGGNADHSTTYKSTSSYNGAGTMEGSYSNTSSSDKLIENGGKPSTLTSDRTVSKLISGFEGQGKNSISSSTTDSRTLYSRSTGADWVSQGGRRSMGVSSLGGEGSSYSTGQRYLSTIGNHISGESMATNDQFMRLNAFLGSADLSMILHMLSQRSDTDLLSAPKVLTRPGEEAIMKVVTEYIYPTDYDVQLQSSSSSGSYNGGSQSAILAVVEPQSFTMREVGVILQVTPTLTDDGNVVDLELNTQVVDEPTWKNYGMRIPFTGNSSNMDIASWPEPPTLAGFTPTTEQLTPVWDTMMSAYVNLINSLANRLGGASNNITYYDAPMEQPFFHVRQVDSKVSVYPGATIVMGGLITEARKAMDDKIPFLGDIPFIGRLFRSHSEQTSKRNLLIFVTTRVVDGRGREMTSDQLDLSEKSDVTAAPEAPAN